jgi:NAD(P)-dependent dehydrogenase (short-subunit alcohol dehydrogenase family)
MSGRIALVTGASSGIGRAAATELARRGLQVMATARREELLKELARQTGASYIACPLETPDGPEKILEETRRRLGPVEVLINNAAIGTADDGSVLETPFTAWRQTMDMNLDVQFRLTQLAARDMVDRGWGRVVMVSSTAGQVGGANMVSYCASKHGLLGLMRAAAMDLARYGVTCNAVLPGWVRTATAERSAGEEALSRGVEVEEVWAEREASYPAGRLITAAEVAHTIAFLASEEASGISGEAITVALGGLW